MLHLKDIMFKSISPLGLKLPVHVCNMDRERESEFTFYLGTETGDNNGYIYFGTFINEVRCWEHPLNEFIQVQLKKISRTALRTLRS